MDVTLYTTPTCGYCRMVKQFLNQRDIPYREKDVSRDRQAAMEMVRRTGQQGVPVTIIDDEVIVGFDRGRLEQVLAQRSRPRPKLGAKIAGAATIARRQGTSLPDGAYVGGVKARSPADRVGLREGDVILSLDGRPLRGASDLHKALSTLSTGQVVPIIWWRNGRELSGELIF